MPAEKKDTPKRTAAANKHPQGKIVDGADNNSPLPNTLPPEQKKLQQTLEQLQALTRQQQLQREENLQSTLNQAAATLQESQRVKVLAELLQQLGQKISNPVTTADPQPLLQIIKEMENQVYQELKETDDQAAQALQQAVSALAQSQAALFANQNYQEIKKLLAQCKNILEKHYPPDKV